MLLSDASAYEVSVEQIYHINGDTSEFQVSLSEIERGDDFMAHESGENDDEDNQVTYHSDIAVFTSELEYADNIVALRKIPSHLDEPVSTLIEQGYTHFHVDFHRTSGEYNDEESDAYASGSIGFIKPDQIEATIKKLEAAQSAAASDTVAERIKEIIGYAERLKPKFKVSLDLQDLSALMRLATGKEVAADPNAVAHHRVAQIAQAIENAAAALPDGSSHWSGDETVYTDQEKIPLQSAEQSTAAIDELKRLLGSDDTSASTYWVSHNGGFACGEAIIIKPKGNQALNLIIRHDGTATLNLPKGTKLCVDSESDWIGLQHDQKELIGALDTELTAQISELVEEWDIRLAPPSSNSTKWPANLNAESLAVTYSN